MNISSIYVSHSGAMWTNPALFISFFFFPSGDHKIVKSKSTTETGLRCDELAERSVWRCRFSGADPHSLVTYLQDLVADRRP